MSATEAHFAHMSCFVVVCAERAYYYYKREQARGGMCCSLILDKWDQKKCSQPWFVQPIKGAKLQESCKQKVQWVGHDQVSVVEQLNGIACRCKG